MDTFIIMTCGGNVYKTIAEPNEAMLAAVADMKVDIIRCSDAKCLGYDGAWYELSNYEGVQNENQ